MIQVKRIVKGKITEFDSRTYKGIVVVDGKRRRFLSPYFHSGRPPRSPRVGEVVEVLFSPTRTKILCLRAL
jgi:hypothetical protein